MRFLLILFFVLMPLAGFAQNLPSDQPGAQGSRFKSESEQEKKRLEKKKAKAPEIAIEKEAVKPALPAGEELTFVLNSVKITGATVFKPEELKPVYAGLIGRQVSFTDLERIAQSIKAAYRKKGYLLADAYLPEQDITGGQVEIRVSEGALGQVRIEGNQWFSSRALADYVHLKKNQIINVFTLQRDLLRLNQNPDLQAAAVVSAGVAPGTTDIVIKVKDKRTWHAGAGFDNQGTRLVGRNRYSLSLRSTNVSGMLDSLVVYTMLSANSTGEFAGYTLPLNSYGTTAGVDVTLFKMRLGREYRDQDIVGTTQMVTPHLTHELHLAQDFQAYADLGIDIKSIKKRNAGEVTTDDQLRIPYLAFDLTRTDALFGGGQTSFSPKFSFGTDGFLGASSHGHPSGSRPGTGGFFFKYDQILRRLQRMPFSSYISARSQFQAATHTLPSSEQLQIGGANTVRGYPEGEYLADTGAILNLEWSLPGFFINKAYKLPHATMPLRQQLRPEVFVDTGGGRVREPSSNEKTHRFLMGAGAGIRFDYNGNFSIRLDWAKRLGDRPTPGQGPSTFYVTAQSEF